MKFHGFYNITSNTIFIMKSDIKNSGSNFTQTEDEFFNQRFHVGNFKNNYILMKKQRGFIVFMTAIVTLLCVYYLSFTFVSKWHKKMMPLNKPRMRQGILTFPKDRIF